MVQSWVRYEVAPYVGAWIETFIPQVLPCIAKSHPTWVRGLKLFDAWNVERHIKSHPTWVRGLKHRRCRGINSNMRSHPTWVRGLKRIIIRFETCGNMSHPTWVRGLKPLEHVNPTILDRRTLRGCVD